MASTPRIAFWCGRALEPWGPPSLNEGGIGGSETAVVHIARRFAQAGWKVDVFANPDHMEGVHDGVGYWDCKRLPRDARYDVLVVWRDPNGHALPIQAPVRLAWLHDQHYGPDSGPDLARYDRVLGVSQHHADFLAHAYGLTNVDFVPNGIELERFDRTIQKEPFKCVWSSSPDRDLDLMLRLWPRITKVEPAATLHVAYGWQGVDFRIKMGDQEAVALKDRLQRTMDSTPGVTWYGRVGQAELAKMKCESWCSPYFTGFWEVSCCVGDTLIDMPRDYTKYPMGVPIKELVGKSGFPTWCYNEDTGRFQLAPVKCVAKTGTMREIWKVEWDDGTSLRATPDHLVLTYDRGWVQLKDLTPGESVVALKKHAIIAVSVGAGPWPPEHRLIMEFLHKGALPAGFHVDHRDGNPLNNSPENLQLLSPSEHASKTFKGIKRTKAARSAHVERWRQRWDADPEYRERTAEGMRARARAMWDGMSPEERSAFTARQNVGRRRRITLVCVECGAPFEVTPSRANTAKACSVDCRHRMESARLKARAATPTPAFNHKVVSVAFCGYEDVYDMEVDGPHNFVAGGVVIHNCISMMESMAAGAVPVCSSTGALKETVGPGGYVIPGNPFAAAPQDFFLRICHAVLGEANARVSRMHAGYARAETYTWDAAFNQWLRIVNASLNPAIAA